MKLQLLFSLLILPSFAFSISIEDVQKLEAKTIRDKKVIYHYTKLSRKDGKDKDTGKYVGNYFRGRDGKVIPLAIDKDKEHKWKTEYTKYAIDAISDDSPLLTDPLNENGIGKNCENYSVLSLSEKKMVWSILLSAMAKFESSYDPDLKFPEPGKKDENGNQRYSGGLLQSSYSDKELYGCPYSSGKDVFDQEKNIQCAVKIFETRLYKETDKLVYKNSTGKYVPIAPTKGVIFSEKRFNAANGDGIYWSVLNAKSGSNKEKEDYYGVKEIFEKYSEALCDPDEYVKIELESITSVESVGFPPVLDSCPADEK